MKHLDLESFSVREESVVSRGKWGLESSSGVSETMPWINDLIVSLFIDSYII